eukprot:TRINITY_DN136736_c0_g1_i1.p1 TRINITY_DN136736_c0_g1~~TRINITY_DN136736_c0_g1_i1.p1  ORF type:complete len:180 (+),score=62.21 TRINITY_DN136736_c0_g1_i1:94-633(+)
MGIDIKRKHIRKGNRTAPASQNVYLRLLVKLYSFLARRTGSNFNKVVLKRLFMSKLNRPPVSVRKVAEYMKGKKDNQIAVVVGTVTDDKRMLDLPKLTVCALRFTKSARARVTKAGGVCLTFDQLAVQRPKGSNCLLIRGPKNTREAVKHFGVPGAIHSHAKPYLNSEGRKFQRSRGKR